MTLGGRIRFVRNGLSQKEFSDKFGVAVSTLRRYETDVIPPGADFLLAICDCYKVSSSWLLAGEGPMSKDQANENASSPAKEDVERQLRGSSPGRCNVSFIEDPIITDLKLWLNELVSEDPDNLAWFRIELQDKLPKFKAWREKKRTPDSFESYNLA